MRVTKNQQVESNLVTVDNEMRSYENDPFFIKKAEAAKETLKRVGLPQIKKKK